MATGFSIVNAESRAFSIIVSAHGDLKTAQTSTEIKYPSSITSANFKWLKIGPDVGGMLLRARYPTGASVDPTTQPVIVVFGGWPQSEAAALLVAQGAPPTDASFITMRIDNIDSDATGTTLTLDTAADHRDGTYKYSNYFQPFPTTLIAGDFLGAPYVAIGCQTALSGGTGITTCDLLATFLPR